MDFNFTEEQSMVRDTVASFLRDKYDFDTRRKIVSSDAGWRAEASLRGRAQAAQFNDAMRTRFDGKDALDVAALGEVARLRGEVGGDDEGGLGLIGTLAAMIIAPIAATIIQLAISRQREYLADATSVRFTRNPQGLVSALRKLESARTPLANANRAVQHLFIVNPLRAATGEETALMATHPSIGQHNARLLNLGDVRDR